MARRIVVAGPRTAVQVWKGLPGDDVVRAHRYAPLDLLRSLTMRDEVVLLEGWETDRDACALVVVGLWLGVPFWRVELLQLVECNPQSPVAAFVDLWAGNTAVRAA